MNWLSMIPPKDRQEIVRELATRLSAEPILVSTFEKAVETVLQKYMKRCVVCHGFLQSNGDCQACSDRISSPSLEQTLETVLDRHGFKRLSVNNNPVIDLVNQAKLAAEEFAATSHGGYKNTRHYRKLCLSLRSTAAAVEQMYGAGTTPTQSTETLCSCKSGGWAIGCPEGCHPTKK